ncbi:MAG: hypothetical protein Q9182_002048 [Xanthomendoza sp. 2 TL-2023]
MAQSRILLIVNVLFIFAATSLAVGTDCFVPNGTDRNKKSDVSPDSIAYVPCNQKDPFSMCCRYGNDDCLPNGLCRGRYGSSPLWRESCTDPTWTSPYCLNLCTKGGNASGEDYSQSDTTVHKCPDDSYCCGSNNSTCCGTSEAKWIVNGQVTNINPSATSSSTSKTSSTTSLTSSATATPLPGQAGRQQGTPAPTPQPSGGGTNAGAIAGGVIGGAVALALIGAAIWFFRRRGRQGPEVHRQTQPELADGPLKAPAPRYHVHPGLHEAEGGWDGTTGKGMSEVDSQARYEIGDQKKDMTARQELE